MNSYYLRRIGIQPSLLKYLNPLFGALAFVGLYALIGIESMLAKILVLGFYLTYCFATEEELRGILKIRARLRQIADVHPRSI
ncbi:MAG: hypothetical protein ACE5I1_11270 [bacterium]